MKRPIASGQTGRRRGFSLAEVVIAIGVITVGLVSVLALFPTALQTNHSAQDETRAGHIAQSIFGSLVAQAPLQFTLVRLPALPSCNPSGTPPAINLTATPPPNGGPTLVASADND